MKKKNNKGFTLVEIIIASVMALAIVYFLISATIKMVNKNNDYYIESLLVADKNVITKEIMDDFNNNDLNLSSISQNGDGTITINFKDSAGVALPPKTIKFSNDSVQYGEYTRKISDKLNIVDYYISTICADGKTLDEDPDCATSNNNANLIIELPAHTNYNSKDYGIKINIPYVTKNVNVTIPKPIVSSGKCGANVPKLTEGLIPVYYNEERQVWEKANITNEGDHWYNYCASKWANAVLVSDASRTNYKNASKGEEIKSEDIIAFYVWIPRYKYRVWNINKTIGTDSYDMQNNGIDIEFERNIETTGTITCNYDFGITATETVRNEKCSGSNGDFYTHPAFTIGEEQLTGFWMGKFESSGTKSDETITDITILPNVYSLGGSSQWGDYNSEIYDMYMGIKNMQKTGNGNGLSSDETKVDSHMINNMEWGAVAYLSHSDYGRCDTNSCSEVAYNNHSTTTSATGKTGKSSGVAAEYAKNGTTSYDYDEYLTKLDTSSGEKANLKVTKKEGDWSCDTNASTIMNCEAHNSSSNSFYTNLTIEFEISQTSYLNFDYLSFGQTNLIHYNTFTLTKDGEIYDLSTAKTNKHSEIPYGKLEYLDNMSMNLWIELEAGKYKLNFKKRNNNLEDYDFNEIYLKNIQIIKNPVFYNEAVGPMASTTGNIYGVYDMSGGFGEWTWSNMSSTNGIFNYNTMNTYDVNNGTHTINQELQFLKSTEKYMTKYAWGSTCYDQTAFNRSRLGDATGEMVFSKSESLEQGYIIGSDVYKHESGGISVYNDSINMPCSYLGTDVVTGNTKQLNNSTILRGLMLNGGTYDGLLNMLTGIFTSVEFYDHYDDNMQYTTTRAILTVY